MITKLPYGIKGGELTSIHNVLSGLDCNCVCPKCGSKLIARKGEHKTHHFAHYHETNCEGAAETALHLVAKEILIQEKKLVIPGRLMFKNGSLIKNNSKEIIFDEVRSEEKTGDFQPDIIGIDKGRELFIEIAVTHFIDEIKHEKLIKYGTSTLEINLEALKDGFNTEELKQYLLEETSNKQWIYNSEEEKAKKLYYENETSLDTFENQNEKKWELKVQNFEKFKKENIKAGFRIIKVDIGENVYCPLKMKNTAKSLPKSYISDRIGNGGVWNGVIDDKRRFGMYIDLDNKKFPVFPPDNMRTDTNVKMGKFYFHQLNRIRDKSIQNYRKCIRCKFFKGSNLDLDLTLDETEIVCGYK
ncbi:competence protein CoiA family protein [Marivirga salinae]|uniref:Competence protein CoiA family protein n=1 Tax=Marivirga salinarum TaxID=3059078 RepID=A0AA51NEI4_9BACT|nr:competence protein CoiA family protein [Marivirga sp. BDSF4-3]WMN12805.1 competence protein CoiA family protein [Marivirga sp. BDSF4-3]